MHTRHQIWQATIFIIGFGMAQVNAEDTKKNENPLDPTVVVNNKKFIEVTGYGTVDPAISNDTQRRATTCEAATVQAQAKMLEVINSLRVVNANPMPTTETPAIQHLQGAKVLKTQYTDDGHCQVLLRLNKKEYQKSTGTKLRDR